MEETEDCIDSGLATFCQLEVSKSFTVPEEFVQMLGIIPQKNVGTMSEHIQDNSFKTRAGWLFGEGDSSEDGFVIWQPLELF